MEIEVITTKRKLTKSIVKQLNTATINDIKHFNSMPTIGFYVRDLGAKYQPRVAIFEGINRWVILEIIDWRESQYGDRAVCKNRYLDFKTVKERDSFLIEYDNLKKSCLKNHLII